MACVGRFASADEYRSFWCIDLPRDPDEAVRESEIIESMLDAASADIHAAMAASDQCDCTLAGWASNYLAKIAEIEAAVIHNCPCGRALTDTAQRQMWLTWIDQQLTAIRRGDLALCEGETGNDFPYLQFAEQSVTVYNAVRIVRNRYLRGL